jgi:hypothetical protein
MVRARLCGLLSVAQPPSPTSSPTPSPTSSPRPTQALDTRILALDTVFPEATLPHGDQLRILVRVTDGVGNAAVGVSNCVSGDRTPSVVVMQEVVHPRIVVDGADRVLIEPASPTDDYVLDVGFDVHNDVAPSEFISACWGTVPVRWRVWCALWPLVRVWVPCSVGCAQPFRELIAKRTHVVR